MGAAISKFTRSRIGKKNLDKPRPLNVVLSNTLEIYSMFQYLQSNLHQYGQIFVYPLIAQL